ncbi:hypothetical protein AAC387_Pa04g1651 [Persea americana]
MLVKLSKSQDSATKDGATIVIVIAGALLKNCVHPIVIAGLSNGEFGIKSTATSSTTRSQSIFHPLRPTRSRRCPLSCRPNPPRPS